MGRGGVLRATRIAGVVVILLLSGVPAAVSVSAPRLRVPVQAATRSDPYWLVASDGGVFAFGGAGFFGSTGGMALSAPIVGMAEVPSSTVTPTAQPLCCQGYWLAAADGGVFSFGRAPFLGSGVGQGLSSPVVAIAATVLGQGYFLLTQDQVYGFGDADNKAVSGTCAAKAPLVGMAPMPGARGYWILNAAGTVYPCGDAPALVTTGGALTVGKKAVGIATTLSGHGYWVVAADGSVLASGDAAYHGGAEAIHLVKPIVAIAPSSLGDGYRLIASDGGVFSYGAPYLGGLGGMHLNAPILGASSAFH